jgi:tetratricopeptide (TPR) repeat protein
MPRILFTWELGGGLGQLLSMQRGLRYLLTGDYAKALPLLRKEWERYSEDVVLVGAATDFGVALLCMGQFRRAEQHFLKLQKSALATVSDHFIYGGLGSWFAGRSDDAIAMWKRGLKAQYSSFQGFDVPFVLWYAALRRPETLSLDEVRDIIVQRLKRLSMQSYAWHVARYLLQE